MSEDVSLHDFSGGWVSFNIFHFTYVFTALILSIYRIKKQTHSASLDFFTQRRHVVLLFFSLVCFTSFTIEIETDKIEASARLLPYTSHFLPATPSFFHSLLPNNYAGYLINTKMSNPDLQSALGNASCTTVVTLSCFHYSCYSLFDTVFV